MPSVKVKVPAAVGVLEIVFVVEVAVESMLTPSGNAPEMTPQVSGWSIVVEAVSVTGPYALPTIPFERVTGINTPLKVSVKLQAAEVLALKVFGPQLLEASIILS